LSLSIKSFTNYADHIFREEVIHGGEINGSKFYDCEFAQCSFVQSRFSECKFVDSSFEGCDLSLLQVPLSRLSGVRFRDSKLVGVNWALADWPGTDIGEPLKFLKCVLNHATFIGLKLSAIQFIECIAIEVDFREADLSTADFSGTDLSKSIFGNTDLSKANLSKARNYHIDASQNILKGTRFSFPEAMSLLYSLDIVLDEKDSFFSEI
jgi:uncharacterized protein YjbI with pentapeptide repeats